MASFKELVKRTPEITGDLGKDAREMVNFRVLDTLVPVRVRSNGSVSPAPVSEKKLVPTERCENVVVGMLLELKDAILEGKQPAIASLKDKSGLSSSYKSGDRTAVNDADPNKATGLSDSQTVARGGNVTCPDTEILNCRSQEDCRNRNFTPSKRDTSHLESENQALRSHFDTQSLDHRSDTQLQITKKPKQGDSLIAKVGGHDHLPSVRDQQRGALVDELNLDLNLTAVRDEQPEAIVNTSATLLPVTKKLKHDASLTGLAVGHEPLLAVKNEQPEALVYKLDLVLPDKQTKDDRQCCAETRTSNAAPQTEACKNICSAANLNMYKSRRTPFIDIPHNGTHSNTFSHEAQRDEDHNLGRECTSDSDSLSLPSDGYQDERIDISTRKFDFKLSVHI